MKTFNKITSLCLILILLATTTSAMVFAKDIDPKQFENEIQIKIKEIFEKGFSEFYDINHINIRFDNIEILENKLEACVFVTMNAMLKAQGVEELPYVRGMLREVGLENYRYDPELSTEEKLANAKIDNLTSEKIAIASRIIDNKFIELQEYINKADDNNFFLKVSADIKNDMIVEDSIIIMAENIDSFVPVAALFPKTSYEMEIEGSSDMQMQLQKQSESYSPNLYASYDRLKARDYALKWSSNPTGCYDHGTTCGIRQARNLWNTSQYPFYTELTHNDCADFVSQSLHAGGLPTDSTWKYYQMAWANTGSLKTYMLNKSYWIQSNYTSASAGGVLYTASSHVVLITKNDTITRQFTGHTNDRKEFNYSNVSGYVYYVLWQ